MMAYEDTDDYKNLKKAAAREAADAAEPGTETMAAFMKRTGTKARPPMARTYTKKGPIVTKEQMKKAGFDNLRDYLNAERGLTRRKDKAAPVKSAAPTKSPADYEKDAEDFKRMAFDSRAKTEATRDLMNRMLGKEKFEAGSMPPLPDLETDPRSLSGPFKKGGMVKKMKSGGTVSSASKQADGCAVRGKTKGRMI
jgi:hypothetical protein